MSHLRKRVQQGTSIVVSALLVLFLWPFAPVQGTQAWAEEEPATLQDAHDPQDVDLPAEEPLETGEAALLAASEEGQAADVSALTPEEQLAQDKEDDKGVFEQIALIFEGKSYAYRTASTLADDDFLPGPKPELKCAGDYRYEVIRDDADLDGVPDTSDHIQVEFSPDGDIFKLSITPTSMDPGQVRIDVFHSSDDDHPLTYLSFQVKNVDKKKLTGLTVASLPFRLSATEQEDPAKAAVEDAVKNAPGMAAEDLQGVSDAGRSVLSNFKITTYPDATANESGFDAGISFALDAALDAKYQLDSPPSTIHIDGIEAVATPAGFGLTDGADASHWKNLDSVEATYVGHTLSKTLDGFADSVPLNSAEGAYQGLQLYAQDDSGVITKITDIAYNLDRTAPKLTAFSVDDSFERKGIFGLFANSAQMTVTVADLLDNLGSTDSADHEGDFLPELKVAGLVPEDARVEYHDAHSGQTQVKTGLDVRGANNESGILQFVVDGDQEVEVSSYRVYVKDAAGNSLSSGMEGVTQIPADVLRLVTDSGAPQLSVSFDNNDMRNGRYFNAGRTGVWTVTEPNFHLLREFDPDQEVVRISEGGQLHVFRVKDFQQVSADRWQVSYDFFSDEDYTAEARIVDLVGKSSEALSLSFTVDKTAPSINVTFDNEGAATGSYYSAARTATISITEHNFSSDLINVAPTSGAGNGTSMGAASPSGWSSNGDTHTCTVSFPGPGVYSMTVSGTDAALNSLPAYTCPEFTVDTEKPQISIQVNGDADASSRAYRDGCSVSVTIDDTNVDPSSTVTITPIGLNGTVNPYLASPSSSATQISYTCADPARSPENDNVYRIEVNALDLAGNAETKVVDWSVNRFGSTYVLDGDTQDMVDRKYLKTEDTRDVRITEINPSGINEDEVLVSLASGAKNSTLQRDQDYTFQPHTANDWPAYEYVISKSNFASDGTYQVMLHSTDAAGNASMNTMDNKSSDRAASAEVIFSVDNTAPIVTFNGFNDGSVSANEHEVGFSIEDNTKLDRAVIRLNGEKVKTLDGEELEDPDNLKLTLTERGENQMLTVEAYDKANNMDPQDSPSIFVNSNPLLRWLHDPVMIVGALLVAAAIVAAVVFLLIPFLKRRKG